MAVQMLGIKTKFTDDQGRPLIGGSVHTYYAGTSLPQDTFSDPELTAPNTNPVKLDDTGSANIFLKGTYRVRVFDRNGKFVEEQDNVDQLATVADVFKNKGGLNAANERIDALTSEVNSVKEKTLIIESIDDLSTINNPKDGLRVYVKSYHAGGLIGGGEFVWVAGYDKAKANGGTIIDPDGLSSYNGTYSTLRVFLDTQGAGVGQGCWVSTDTADSINLTKFGIIPAESLDEAQNSSFVFQKAIDTIISNKLGTNTLLIPAGVLYISESVVADMQSQSVKSFKFIGAGQRTVIHTNVVGQPAFDFTNIVWSEFRDFMLLGNGKSGELGSGHGISMFQPADRVFVVGRESHTPAHILIDSVHLRGFKGKGLGGWVNMKQYHADNGVGATRVTIDAAGLFICGGTLNKLNHVTVAECHHGAWIEHCSNLYVDVFIAQACVHSQLLIKDPLSKVHVKGLESVGISDATTPIITKDFNGFDVSLLPGHIVVTQPDSIVIVESIRAKGTGTVISLNRVEHFELKDSFLRTHGPHELNYTAFVHSVGNADTKTLIINNCKLHGSVTSTNIRGIYVQAATAGQGTSVDVTNCRIGFNGEWTDFLQIDGVSALDRLPIKIKGNVLYGGGAVIESSMTNFVNTTKCRIAGEISNNTFVLVSQTKNATITNIANLDNTYAHFVECKGNIYKDFGSLATITNKLGNTEVYGYFEGQVEAGHLSIPVNMAFNPQYVSIQLADNTSDTIKVHANLPRTQLANQLRFLVRNVVDDTFYTGDIKVMYHAKCMTDTQTNLLYADRLTTA